MRPCRGKPHIRHIIHTDALGIVRGLPGRGDPLMGGSVTDPGRASAMEMEIGPVLGKQTLGPSPRLLRFRIIIDVKRP